MTAFFWQISSNGLISFTRPFLNFKNRNFSDGFYLFEEGIIAVLWTDLNFTHSGSLYHRVSTDGDDLRLIADMISTRNSEYCQYEPTVVVVVTWANVSSRNASHDYLKVSRLHYTIGYTNFQVACQCPRGKLNCPGQ